MLRKRFTITGFSRRWSNFAVAALVATAVLIAVSGAAQPAYATIDPAKLACPLEPSPDGILIDITGNSDGFLLGAPGLSPSQIGPMSVAVPAGTYRVSWASWDDHAGHGGQGQLNEQWYLEIGGATSVDTEDIPEDQDAIQGVLGTNLVVPTDASSVTVLHGGPPDTVNSVYALCATLEPLSPGIDIEKATNGEDADLPTGPSITVGDEVTWTYVVTNTGEVDLSGVIVTDDILGPVCEIGDLAVGASETCEATGVATAGQYANVGTAVDNNGENPTATDTDPSHYVGIPVPVPGIDIEKATNGEDADTPTGPPITVGEPVTWTYVVTNTGEVDLTGVIVTDDILGDICVIGDLAVGASDTCEATGAAVAGQYANVGTATDNNGIEPTVTDTDQSHYFGQEVAANATIGDTVWSDENANGVQDNGEKGIAGATVRLTLPDGSTIEMNTNANGLYLFSGLEAGEYKSELILSSIPDPSEGSLKLTTAGSFTIQLADGQSFLDADFGVVAALPNTGVSADQLAVIALLLVAAGASALFATRRRETNPA